MSDIHSTDVEYRDLTPLGFPGYRVGSDGSVWSAWKLVNLGYNKGTKSVIGNKWKRMKPHRHRIGYLEVKLHYRFKLIHRIVLEAFIGPCPVGMECCHNDGDRKNNTLANLRWDTHKANKEDSIKHGTIARGESHGCAKLTAEIVRQIRDHHTAAKAGRQIAPIGTNTAMAKKYNVSVGCIERIIAGKSWKTP